MNRGIGIPVDYADVSIASDGAVLVMTPRINMVSGQPVLIVFRGSNMIISQAEKIYADIKNVQTVKDFRKAPEVLVMEADETGYTRLHEQVKVAFR